MARRGAPRWRPKTGYATNWQQADSSTPRAAAPRSGRTAATWRCATWATTCPAALCSTGQQKALLLSIVLAHARLLTLDRGHTALLLLDEVVAHLDQERRAALFDEPWSRSAPKAG